MYRIGRMLRTIRLVCSLLRLSTNKNGSPLGSAVAFAIKTKPSGSETGETGFFFPDTASFAAPFLLFRLKRLGYSDCRVTSQDGGLHLFARR
ncbi:hypothetical protein [Geobacter argillaceus]|uniref:Uncharacterized protein n=1 Tax=Geobacter argillaceus TaxID=345631 RepID=A0A562WSV2_9BACT|nr:hypothetical protein [Geobacter argillaceus]TWJ33513.1 hypothetical protein JN12_00187 [Geobacter argillaceus]